MTLETEIKNLKTQFPGYFDEYLENAEVVSCFATRQGAIHQVFIITNRQVLRGDALTINFFGKVKFSSPNINSMFLKDIVTVNKNDGFGQKSWVTVTGHGTAQILFEFNSVEASSNFSTALQNTISQFNTPTITLEKSPAERLRQLERLLTEGLISENEYQDKRKEIIQKL